MDDDTKKLFKTMSYLSTIGMTMSLSIAIGAGIGYYLDKRFETEPWLFFVFFIFGLIAAFKNLHTMFKKIKEKEEI